MKDQKWFEDMELRIPHGEVRTRFAPSPTGYMHVGNLRTALYTYLIARHAGGKFILRIEDTDQGRYVEGAVDVIYSTMRACGLTHDEGPDVGGPVGPYVQTERRGLYKEYAELLIARGHAYRCFCDKDDAAEENVSDGTVIHKYDGRCSRLSEEEIAANLAAGKPYVIRQKIPREGKTTFHDEIFGDITVDNDTLDDQVLIKRDGLPTYNFANVIDDHLMGITHVVRGSEYLSSTPKYNLLYEGFGWEIPKYIHCSPVMRDQHNKMSKRHGDPSYEDLIAQGYLSQAVVNYVALLGWSLDGETTIIPRDVLASKFSLDRISKNPATFDPKKLDWVNAEYINGMSDAQFADEIMVPELHEAGLIEGNVEYGEDWIDALAAIVKPRTKMPADAVTVAAPIFATAETLEYDEKSVNKGLAKEGMGAILDAAKAALEGVTEWTAANIDAALEPLPEQMDLKKRVVFQAVRVAVCGNMVSPPLGETMALVGRDDCLTRIDRARTMAL